MCTAIGFKTKDFYFGRTLDYDLSFGEEITVTGRYFPFSFKNGTVIESHFAIIGMAHIADGYPLYYDAVNEKGLAMAALNFVGNAYYKKPCENCDNIAHFELIPWILGQCADITAAKNLLEKINITDIPFNESLSPALLHWIISDKNGSLTIEAVEHGIKIYDNPVGVLTNNPTFPEQMQRLNDYMHLSVRNPENNFSKKLPLICYSRGMGSLGLPGDLSSSSRFVRAAFVKMNSVSENSEDDSVGQFFHILDTVNQPRGCCETDNGKFEITVYSSCCNTNKGIYYYTTYSNRQISAVDMHKTDLNSNKLTTYPLINQQQINYQN